MGGKGVGVTSGPDVVSVLRVGVVEVDAGDVVLSCGVGQVVIGAADVVASAAVSAIEVEAGDVVLGAGVAQVVVGAADVVAVASAAISVERTPRPLVPNMVAAGVEGLSGGSASGRGGGQGGESQVDSWVTAL